MITIMYAVLYHTNTTDMGENYVECQLGETFEADCGREWDGDVLGYVHNNIVDEDEGITIDEHPTYAIHNEPDGAIVISVNGEPSEIYWAEEIEKVEEDEE